MSSDFKSISKITVVGTGVMGLDISLAFAKAGYDVTAVDIAEDILVRAAEKIRSNCSFLVEEKIIGEEDSVDIQSRIKLTSNWEEALSDADYVTEAVTEEMKIKQDVFRRCDKLCPPSVVIASNTSSMSIDQISSLMEHPERAVVTHWIIPALLSPIVEVIGGEDTSDEVLSSVISVLKSAGKQPVLCKDSPGFIHNYVQFAMVKAALDLIERGVATAEGIDNVIRNGFGLRLSTVGPIRFVDLCGLDTFLNVQKSLFELTNNEIYKPSKSVEEKVLGGMLGAKSGIGYYKYEKGEVDELQSEVSRSMIRVLRAVYGDGHVGMLNKKQK